MSSTKRNVVRPTRGAMGGLEWRLPGSDTFTLVWFGNGAVTLFLSSAKQLIPVEPDKYRVFDGTEKTARAAAAAFIADGKDD